MLMIIKKFEFEYAHKLPNHPGKCKFLHGHRGELEVGIAGPVDIDTGMIMDFSMLKKMVKERVIDILDHSYLNELAILPGFPCGRPTAENIIRWIVNELKKGLLSYDLTCELVMVRLWETSGSLVEWTK
jgi:6-pyruvoyltetrahydropterin/6-carboxytetrahydropterin synthase